LRCAEKSSSRVRLFIPTAHYVNHSSTLVELAGICWSFNSTSVQLLDVVSTYPFGRAGLRAKQYSRDFVVTGTGFWHHWNRIWVPLSSKAARQGDVSRSLISVGVHNHSEIPTMTCTLIPSVIGALRVPFTTVQTSCQCRAGWARRRDLLHSCLGFQWHSC